MSIIDMFKIHAGAKAALPGLGLVSFDGQGSVRFALNGTEFGFSVPSAGFVEDALVSIWSGTKSRSVLVFSHSGSIAASFQLEEKILRVIQIPRDLDLEPGLWRTKFVETPLGPLIVHELGMIAIDWDGDIRWRVEIPHIQWSFLGLDGDRVVLDSEFDGQWRYRIEDGQRDVERPS